ncbi:Rad4-domain-containing protein [Rozella allomycis CSF55]|uniref:Rad4-domain-containing protein n=1 Tax=Rozella allomycis (strain CSF55) TaxID=988480 RepID=A0A4V1IZS6_ROZAC|nr:Rad4-domain-containing protein [Rozella allomycis CSF55]
MSSDEEVWDEINVEDKIINTDTLKDTNLHPETVNVEITNETKRISPQQRLMRRIVHRVHFMCLFVHYKKFNLQLNSSLHKSHLLSILPESFLNVKHLEPKKMAVYLKLLSRYLHSVFKIESLDDEEPLGLLEAFQQRKVYEDQFVAFFVIIMRSLGLKCRLVVSFNPVSYKSTSHITNPKKRIKLDETSLMEYPLTWAEVLNEFDKRWIHGAVKDITVRYCAYYGARTVKLRTEERLWDYMLSLNKKFYVKPEDKLENEEFLERQRNETLPTTKTGFKNHPLYVLESQIRQNQAIYPKTPVFGLFNGESVYSRSNLKSKEAWLKEARAIKDGEIAIKTVKARTLKKKAASEELADNDTCPLYGIWQTRPYVPPKVVDVNHGKVPRNEFGNLYVFRPEMVPDDCCHIPYKGIDKIAKKLDIDYVDAVVRFEFNRGRSFPVLEGIIVLEKHRDILVEAYEQVENHKVQSHFEEIQGKVINRWSRLIKKLIIRDRVNKLYA